MVLCALTSTGKLPDTIFKIYGLRHRLSTSTSTTRAQASQTTTTQPIQETSLVSESPGTDDRNSPKEIKPWEDARAYIHPLIPPSYLKYPTSLNI